MITEGELLQIVGSTRVVQPERHGGIAGLFGRPKIVDPVADLAGRADIRIVYTKDAAKLRSLGEPVADVSGARCIAIIVVLICANGVQLVGGQVVVELIKQAAVHRSGPAVGLKIAALVGAGQMRSGLLRIATLGEELDDAGGCFGAEEGALGAANYLHAFDSDTRNVRQVKLSARVVERHAI